MAAIPLVLARVPTIRVCRGAGASVEVPGLGLAGAAALGFAWGWAGT